MRLESDFGSLVGCSVDQSYQHSVLHVSCGGHSPSQEL